MLNVNTVTGSWCSLASLGLLIGCALPAAAADRQGVPEDARRVARELLSDAGFQGGLVAHLGCGRGELTGALHAAGGGPVQGLDRDAADVQRARDRFRSAGWDGQVTARQLSGNRLPYVDNLVNLLVVERSEGVAEAEMMRVLCPKGVLCVRQADGRWQRSVKPWPANIDDWTHYLHSASNNAVAQDEVVGPPRRLQWDAGPKYARHHDRMSSVSAVVSANGRVFEIVDLGPPLSILLPPRWTLVARDAFNGTLLWQRPIETWFTHLWPLKSGPAILPRRLVAVGDTVYVTLGIDAGLTELDAATGEVRRTYAGTRGTEEFVCSDGVLVLVVNPDADSSAFARPERFRRGYQATWWDGKPRQLMAIHAKSGERLWSDRTTVLPGTVASDGRHVVFHDGVRVVCRDQSSGEVRWRSEPVARAEEIRAFYLPTLVLYEDVVLFSGGETAGKQTGSWYESGEDTMVALSLETGKRLWSAYHPPSGYRSAEDLLVAQGLVWTGETTSGRVAGRFTGRDPHSGEVEVEFEPDVSTYWFHHRCYRGKATEKYLLVSRTGTEFIDVADEQWHPNHWVRGACLYGVMPANGLLYAPPHPCACYLEAKLSGFCALAPARSGPRIPTAVDPASRLEQGVAYGDVDVRDSAADGAAQQWPTLRHDAARSGRAGTEVPASLETVWRVELGGRLTSPVIAAGRLYVADVDTHTVHALDSRNGQRLWQFVAGGRVDSPPTIHRGLVLFGCADGWVYCLRAVDGALVWRFLAAPADEQLMSYQQLESVWPLHGSVLIHDGALYCVAGRSMFLDGGLRLWRLDPLSGRVLSQTQLDEHESGTEKRLDDYVSWLNMPPALPDVLSSDGRYVYMRSQPLRPDGTRPPLQPIPRAEDADRGAPPPTQDPEFAHLFSPTGLLDDSWWHRTYWLFGSRFISGWSGYYLSGRVAPAGRILVIGEDEVFGFGRKPQYFRWTVPLEHQLFCAPKYPGSPAADRRTGPVESYVEVPRSPTLDPQKSAIAVAAWIKAERPSGVVLAHGGGAMGYALYLKNKRPHFAVREAGKLAVASGRILPLSKWTHVAGVLDPDGSLNLYVDGKRVASQQAAGLLPGNPQEPIHIGSDEKTNVGDYTDRSPFGGSIDEVQIYHRALAADEIAALAAGEQLEAASTGLVLSYAFDDGKARDQTVNQNHGTIHGATSAAGKRGQALAFTGQSVRADGFQVTHNWARDVPLLVRAMVLAGDRLFVAGPPDVMDEEDAYRRADAPATRETMERQLAAIEGERGGLLWAVSAADGERLGQLELSQPPVFDGMAAAAGRLYLSVLDGSVICLGGEGQDR